MSAEKRTQKKPQAAVERASIQNEQTCDRTEPLKEALTPPLVTSITHTFTPLELARLAATIDPAACNTDDPSDAVIKALELLEKCGVTCTALMNPGSQEQVRVIDDNLPKGSEFARKMGFWLNSRALEVVEKISFLTLAMRDKDPDTLRPYLHQNLKLEGKRVGKKAACWSVRTVRGNLLKMFIDQANEHNRSNASKIQIRDDRIENAAKTQGRPVEAFGSSLAYENEIWRDGTAEYKAFLRSCEVRQDGGIEYDQALKPPSERKQPELVRYDIPLPHVNALIRWKHDIRRSGGSSNVRQLERADVFSSREKNFRKS